MIQIEKAGQRIYLRSTRPTPGLGGVVPGASFRTGTVKTGGSYWSMGLSMAACVALRDKFKEELEIGPELWSWAAAERASTRESHAMAKAKTAKLPRVKEKAPKLWKAMKSRKYQRAGARFLANNPNSILADEPGLGKTLEALAAVIESGVEGPYLVVCPVTAVESVWAREIPRWLGTWETTVLPVTGNRMQRDGRLNGFREGAQIPGALRNTWVIVNPAMARTVTFWVCRECGSETPRKAGKKELVCGHNENRTKTVHRHTFDQLHDTEWGVILADESDQMILKQSAVPTQTRNGMEQLKIREGGFKLAISGTPFRSRPHLLWGTLSWLRPKEYTNQWNWIKTFWDTQDGEFGGVHIGQLRSEALEAQLWDSLAPVLLRRTKAEVAPDMPEKTYVGTPVHPADKLSPAGIWIPMEGPQLRAYNEMLDSSTAALDETSVSAVGVLAELTRLKQFASGYGRMEETMRLVKCNDEYCPQAETSHKHRVPVETFKPELPSNKYAYLLQILEELGYPDTPSSRVVVASQFTATLDLFSAQLERDLGVSARGRRAAKPYTGVRRLTGAVTGKARSAVIDEMNDPASNAQILCLNTKTGGVAITLDYVDHMVILDETWIPDDQTQLEDRIHRVSRPRPVFYHYLRSMNSVDLGIALVNAEREYASRRLLDGRRGVEYAKRVLLKAKELAA